MTRNPEGREMTLGRLKRKVSLLVLRHKRSVRREGKRLSDEGDVDVNQYQYRRCLRELMIDNGSILFR